MAGIHDPVHSPGEVERRLLEQVLARSGEPYISMTGPSLFGSTEGSFATHGFVLSGRLHGISPEQARQMWLRDGAVVFERLHGAFVMAVRAESTGAITIARDVIGQRVLFFHRRNSRTTFSTDLSIVLDLLPSQPGPDRAVIAARLAFEPVTVEQTFYEGVRRLPPGHALELRTHDIAVEKRFWSPMYVGEFDLSPPEIGRALEDTLAAAVKEEIDQDRGTGILLSGGIDSTSVAALTPREVRPLAISASFPRHPGTDETELIARVRAHLGLQGLIATVTDGSVLGGMISYTRRWRLPDPSTTSFFWPEMLRHARNLGAETLLDGEGGDERFAPASGAVGDALSHLHFMTALKLLRSTPGARREPARALSALNGALLGTMPSSAQRAIRRQLLRRDRLLAPSSIRLLETVSAPTAWKTLDGPQWWREAIFLHCGLTSTSGALDHLDRVARSGGVRLAHPMLSRRVLDFVMRVPPHLTLHPAMTRPHLRGAMRRRLPQFITMRPSKSYFNAVRDDLLMRNDLGLARELLLSPRSELRGFVNAGELRSLLDDLPRGALWGGTLRTTLAIEIFLQSQNGSRALDEIGLRATSAEIDFREV